MTASSRLDGTAHALLAALDGATCLPLPSAQPGGFTLAQAYAVGARLRELRVARGERPMGWKIGFTNRSIWARYGVYAPIWGPVWDTTTELLGSGESTLSLAGLNQPRLEPEIVFGFAHAPRSGMSPAELQHCIAWVAHGFEVVHTHCADWKFTAADCLADFALHGRLRVGPRVPVQGWTNLAQDLSGLTLELHGPEGFVERGIGANVLDGPLQALGIWLAAMAEHTPQWQVQAGDVVTTGTLTDAWPLEPGQTWRTELNQPGTGPRLSALKLHTTA